MIFLYSFILACHAELLHLSLDNCTQPYKYRDKRDWLLFYTNDPNGKTEQEFLKAAADKNTTKLSYSLVDCLSTPEICQKNVNNTAIPNIYYLSHGLDKGYLWDWTYEDFSEFGQKITLPLVRVIGGHRSLVKFRDYPFSFVYYGYPEAFGTKDSDKRRAFEQIAKEHQNSHIYFGETRADKVCKLMRVEFRNVPIVKQHGLDEPYDYNVTHFDAEKLEKFIDNHKYAMVTPLTRSVVKEFIPWLGNRLLALAIVDRSNNTQTGKYVGHMRSLAWDLRREQQFNYQFAFLDINTHPDLAQKFNASFAPQLIIVDYRKVNETVYYHGDFNMKNETKLRNLLNDHWDEKISINLTKPLQLTSEKKRCETCEGGIPLVGYVIILMLLVSVGLVVYIIYEGRRKDKQD